MMTPEEFAAVARDHAEHQVAELIAAERDPEARAVLMRNRARIIDKLVDASVIADLKRRLDEARLRGPGESVH